MVVFLLNLNCGTAGDGGGRRVVLDWFSLVCVFLGCLSVRVIVDGILFPFFSCTFVGFGFAFLFRPRHPIEFPSWFIGSSAEILGCTGGQTLARRRRERACLRCGAGVVGRLKGLRQSSFAPCIGGGQRLPSDPLNAA